MKSFPILLVLTGCMSSPPGPALTGVSPQRVSVFVATELKLDGQRIEYDVAADLDHPSQSVFSLDLQVRLVGPETVELLKARRVSTTQVVATVPPTLMLGKYAVELSTARGTARLANAVEVANCFNDCELAPVDGGCFSFPDLDNDGFGPTGGGGPVCLDAGARVAKGGDCLDNDPLAQPDAFEICNGIDDDCDGVIDDGTCVADGGWKVRADTAGDDWVAATNYGRGRVWLLGAQKLLVRSGSGAFADVGMNCAVPLTCAWADVTTGLGYFGSAGAVQTHSTISTSCNPPFAVTGTVAGLQGLGTRVYGATRDGMFLEGNNAGFSLRGGVSGTVNAVHGATGNALFAVGVQAGKAKAWRLVTDGGVAIDEPLPIATQPLTSIWAVDESLAYAVGAQGALLERSRGVWRALPSADAGLSAVRAFGSGRVYVTTVDGRVLRFDGSKWQQLYRHPAAAEFTALTGTAEDDLWAVGRQGLVVHWNE